MKPTSWIILLLIVCSGCATKPVITQKPEVYSIGDIGTYMDISHSKGDIVIEVVYTKDSVSIKHSYDIRYSKKENKYHKLNFVFKGDGFGYTKYEKIGENIAGASGPFYSSENFIRENEHWNEFFELLSPNFKNTDNDGRVKILDSLVEVHGW